MSLIQQSKRSRGQDNRTADLIRHAHEKAAKQFAFEQQEHLLAQEYQAELQRLRQGTTTTTVSQKPSSPSPEPSGPYATWKKIEALAANAQPCAPMTMKAPEVVALTGAPTHPIDGALAVRCIRAWKNNPRARKDFSSVAAFYDFAADIEPQIRNLGPTRRTAGLAFYE